MKTITVNLNNETEEKLQQIIKSKWKESNWQKMPKKNEIIKEGIECLYNRHKDIDEDKTINKNLE